MIDDSNSDQFDYEGYIMFLCLLNVYSSKFEEIVHLLFGKSKKLVQTSETFWNFTFYNKFIAHEKLTW